MADFFSSADWLPLERWHSPLQGLQREIDIWIYQGRRSVSPEVHRVEWRIGGLGHPLGGASYYSVDEAQAKAGEVRTQFGDRALGWVHVVADPAS